MAEPPKDVAAIFLAALDCKTPEERTAYLDEKCGPDADLRRRVEALLQAHDQPGDFLGSPAQRLAESLTAPPPYSSPSDAGTMIAGRYKLLEKIGGGGMGSVWMADQREPGEAPGGGQADLRGIGNVEVDPVAVRGGTAGHRAHGSSAHRQAAGRGHG